MSNIGQPGSQWGMPPDPNPSDLVVGTSRRHSGVGRKESLGPSRPLDSPEGTDSPELRHVQTMDSVNFKLDKLLTGFSKLESRIEATERRVTILDQPNKPKPDPPYDLSEFADGDLYHQPRNWSSHRGSKPYSHGDPHRFSRPGFPARFPENALRRPPHDPGYSSGSHFRYDKQPRSSNCHPGQFTDCASEQLHNRSCWEPPLNRQQQNRSWETAPPHRYSCWDPPMSHQNQGSSHSDYSPRVKMDPPHFDGSDASNWIFRVQYYFDHIMMPEEHRLHYTVMLFDPPVDDWIFNYRANTQFVTWPDFLEDVRHRFDPQCYENYIGLISKLCQTGSVSDYQLAFEKMMNRISGVPESTLLPIYITGLKQPIQRQVKLHRPTTLAVSFSHGVASNFIGFS